MMDGLEIAAKMEGLKKKVDLESCACVDGWIYSETTG